MTGVQTCALPISDSLMPGEALHFTGIDELNAAAVSAVTHRLPNNLTGNLPHNVVSILVKGSRFMKMERVVEALRTAALPASPVTAVGPAC